MAAPGPGVQAVNAYSNNDYHIPNIPNTSQSDTFCKTPPLRVHTPVYSARTLNMAKGKDNSGLLACGSVCFFIAFIVSAVSGDPR